MTHEPVEGAVMESRSEEDSRDNLHPLCLTKRANGSATILTYVLKYEHHPVTFQIGQRGLLGMLGVMAPQSSG